MAALVVHDIENLKSLFDRTRLMYLLFSHRPCAKTDRLEQIQCEHNQTVSATSKHPFLQPALSVTLEIPVMLLHTVANRAAFVQVLFCLLDLAGWLGMTKDQSTLWGERGGERTSGLGKFLATSGMTPFPTIALFGFGGNLT